MDALGHMASYAGVISWSGISFLPTNTTGLRIEQIKACFPYDRPIFRLMISRLVLKCVSITEKFKLLIPLGTSDHNCGPNFSLFYGWHTAYNRSNHLIKEIETMRVVCGIRLEDVLF